MSFSYDGLLKRSINSPRREPKMTEATDMENVHQMLDKLENQINGIELDSSSRDEIVNSLQLLISKLNGEPTKTVL